MKKVLISTVVFLISITAQAQSYCTQPPFPRYAFFHWAQNAQDAGATIANQSPTVMPPPGTYKAGTPPYALVATCSPRVPYVYLYIAYVKCAGFGFYPPLPADVYHHEYRELSDPWCYHGPYGPWYETVEECAAAQLVENKRYYQRNGMFTTTEGSIVIYWFND